MILTESLILSKAKGFSKTAATNDISQVRSINLWGQNLTDVSCLSRLPKLEVISLPVNQISDLSPFAYLENLTELYLRKNRISDPTQLMYLTRLPLKHLWISDNPICQRIPNYRITIIRLFPNLLKLDDKDVTEKERIEASRIVFAESKSEQESPTSSKAGSLSPVLMSPVESGDGIAIPRLTRAPEAQLDNAKYPFHSISKQQYEPGLSKFGLDNERRPATREDGPNVEIRRISAPIHPHSYDERPIRPATSFEDHLVGQGVIGSYDVKSSIRQTKPRSNKPSNAKPSYESAILKEKMFQDHLNVQGGVNVIQVPIGIELDNRKKAMDDLKNVNQGLKGPGAFVYSAPVKQQDHRLKNLDRDKEDNHLKGPAMTVQRIEAINRNARRRHSLDESPEKGSNHVIGSGLEVTFVPRMDQDHRIKLGDLIPHDEQHISGAAMEVQKLSETHKGKIAAVKVHAEHVQGSGMNVVAEDELSFPVMDVVQAPPTNSTDQTRKPLWLEAEKIRHHPDKRRSNTSLLSAVLSIIKDLDTASLQIIQHEIGSILS